METAKVRIIFHLLSQHLLERCSFIQIVSTTVDNVKKMQFIFRHNGSYLNSKVNAVAML